MQMRQEKQYKRKAAEDRKLEGLPKGSMVPTVPRVSGGHVSQGTILGEFLASLSHSYSPSLLQKEGNKGFLSHS